MKLMCTTCNLMVGDQPDAQFFYIVRLFQSSTCFEQIRAHHQEVNCINTASGIVTLRPVCIYVYFNPLHVSSKHVLIIRKSIVLIQHLV